LGHHAQRLLLRQGVLKRVLLLLAEHLLQVSGVSAQDGLRQGRLAACSAPAGTRCRSEGAHEEELLDHALVLLNAPQRRSGGVVGSAGGGRRATTALSRSTSAERYAASGEGLEHPPLAQLGESRGSAWRSHLPQDLNHLGIQPHRLELVSRWVIRHEQV
jgi:hypothetical protein